MRVLMVSSNWPPVAPGGAEAYVDALTVRLADAGHDVAAVTLGIETPSVVGALRPRPHRLDQHRDASPWRRALFHAHDLHRSDADGVVGTAIDDFQPDVVHSHVVTGMSVAALQAPARRGVAHVHTLHDYWLTCWRSTATSRSQTPCGPACTLARRVRLGALDRYGPDVVIGISWAILSHHQPLPAGIPESRVVHHPADIEPVVRPPRRDGPFTFGFLGQLSPNKGVGTLLAAAERMAGAARVVVAGAGRLAPAVRAAAGPTLEYRGWVDGDAREAFFDDIDCLVVPSIWPEPAGLVVREAAARGLPVIAADVGGLPEYVPPASRPLVVPPGDVEALASRMHALMADPAAHASDPRSVPTWPDHLAEVGDAYEAARSLRRAAA